MPKTAIFPGTFDPLTHGHVDLVARAGALFDTVIIAIAESAGKSPAFSIKERMALAGQVFGDALPGKIEIVSFSGLLIDFMLQKNVNIVLRGIRTVMDMEYEFQLATMNHAMNGNIETVFLQASPEYSHVSSTIVREIGAMGGDLAAFVPPAVVAAFQKKFL